jgi:gliding motility-associated-like protein
MDGDGWADILVAAKDNSAIWVYRNLAMGGTLSTASFAAPVSFATTLGFANGSGLTTVDFDNDGKLDMATSGWTGGPGAFATFRNISTPGNLAFETVEKWNGITDESPVYGVADVDGDGLLDLFSGEGASPGATWIIQNISTPGNVEFAVRQQFFGASSHQGATLADLNGDGKPEFIHKIQNFQNQQDIYTNTSTPGSISFGASFTLPVVIEGSMIVYDFNQDGKNDLAWKDGNSSNDIRIRLNTNSGGLLSAADFATEVILDSELNNYGGAALGDINGDGKADILATDNSTPAVFESIYSGGAFGANAFIPAYPFPGIGFLTYPVTPQAADLNGDGKPDMVVGFTNSSPNKIVIYENANIHTPVISINTVSPLAAPVGSSVTITGSFFSTVPGENIVKFGAVETSVLTATTTELTVAVPAGASHAAVSVTRGQLTSTYHLPFTTTFSTGVNFNSTHFAPPVTFTLPSNDFEVDVADLNRDGKPDVIAEGGGSGFILRNEHTSGAITLASLAINDTIPSSVDHQLIDLDGDARPDMLGTNGIARNITNGAKINFSPAQSITLGVGVHNLTDFNQDGKTDFATISGTNVVLTENRTTNGPFAIAVPFASFPIGLNLPKPSSGGYPIVGDFNNDGFPDLIALNPVDDDFSVWRNPGMYRIATSAFIQQTDIATGDNPGRVFKSDFDKDGKLDLAIIYQATTTSSFISVFHNTSIAAAAISFTRIDLPLGALGATRAAISDLDGDSRPEIIVAQFASNRFSIFKNIHTSGALTTASFDAPFHVAVAGIKALHTADLNQDGKPEIIITRAANLLEVYENLITLPTITSFTPASGPVGTTVIITGTNFSTTPSNNTVQFNGTAATVTASTATSITVTVPAGATTGKITVTVAGNTATSATDFTVTVPPTITSFTPTSGPVGTTVVITGTNFSTTPANNTVQFNGTTAIVTASTATSITVTVPIGATTGKITVTVAGSTATSATDFTVTTVSNQPPVIAASTVATNINGIVTINLIPLLSDPDGNLDLSSLQLISSITTQGAAASINGTNQLVLNYNGVSFAGADEIAISVCDDLNACTTQIISITVSGEIKIFNALSPNSDDKNPYFLIANIESLEPENTVSIYNRWGSKVFEVENYSEANAFRGLNQNGNELPSGTYFYKILFKSSGKTQNGFLVMKR